MPIVKLICRFFTALKPPPKMTLSEWADHYFYLSSESSANGGKWHTLPYQKAIMDAFTDPNIEEIWVKKSARVGFTKILNAAIAYYIHQDPCPVMIVQPTIEDGEGYSKEEIQPMLRDVPALAAIAPKAAAKTGEETILHKLFQSPNGRSSLSIVGANSPRGFRRVSRRVVLFDEVNGYPPSAGAEGDQITLGKRRAAYYYNKKIAGGSTPTVKDYSRITKEIEKTNQHYRYLPCPHCGKMQALLWGTQDSPAGIKWDHHVPDDQKWQTAYYQCENGCRIEHKWLRWMDERGEWRCFKQGAPRTIGFHLWAAYSYSPGATWPLLVKEFFECKDDEEKFQTWVNTVLGEDFEIQGNQFDWTTLRKRLEPGWLAGEFPPDILVAILTVDVQADRLEAQIVGFNQQEEAWLIDHEVFSGPPEDETTWDALDTWRLKPRTQALDIVLVDSNYATDEVVRWVQPRQSQRVFAVRGEEKLAKRSLVQKGYTKKERLLQWQVATWEIKRLWQFRLGLLSGKGQIHLPEWISDDYLQQITAERLIRTINRKTKRATLAWVKTRDRNEALDLWVYAFAGLRILQTHLDPGTYQDLALLAEKRKTNQTAASTPARPRIVLPAHRR